MVRRGTALIGAGCCAGVFAFALTAGHATAQPRPSVSESELVAGAGLLAPLDPRGEARAAFQRGTAAFEAHDYLEASRAFEAAEALVPHAATRFNLAVCAERLGRLRLAAERFALVARDPSLSPADQQRALARARSASERLARLVVEVAAGGTVQIDGRPCATPCRALVDPGAHEVVAQLGSRELRRRVEAAPGASYEFTLLDSGPATAPRARTTPVGPTRSKAAARRPPPVASAPERTWVRWLGVALTGVGAASWIGFGVYTQGRANEFDRLADAKEAERAREVADEGRRGAILTNVAIGTTLVGVALLSWDLLTSAPDAGPAASRR